MVSIERRPTEEIVISAISGDELAFSDIFEKYYPMVYDFAVWQTGNPALAEDIAQETFIRAYHKLHQLKPPYNVKSWLFRIARNLHIDHTRRQKPEAELDAETGTYDRIAAPDSTVPEAMITSNELSNPARQAIQRLSTNHRTMLVMREIHDYSYDEIADAMNVELNYVKVNLHRARKKFEEVFSYQLLLEDTSATCDVLDDLRLDAYYDGELSGQQIKIIKQHIKDCDACQRRKHELVAIGQIFSIVPMMLPEQISWAEVQDRFSDFDPDADNQSYDDQPFDAEQIDEMSVDSVAPTQVLPQVQAETDTNTKHVTVQGKVLGGVVVVLALIVAGGLFLATGNNDDIEPIVPVEQAEEDAPAEPIEAAAPSEDDLPAEPVNAEAPEATQDSAFANPTPTAASQNQEAVDEPGFAPGGSSLVPTATPTEEPTPTPTEAVERTVETVPVFNCTPLGGGVFEWYEAERVYEDGELVSEEVVSGPVSGPWQPGCPPEPPSDDGGGSSDDDGDGGSSDEPAGEGDVCTADSQCPSGCLCLSGVCTCPAMYSMP